MNIRLLFKLLGIVSLLIGVFMLFSLIWAFPDIGVHTHIENDDTFESAGLWGLIESSVVCGLVSALLFFLGRNSEGKLFRKEAMAVVGLSWILATFLGALPFIFSGTIRGTSVQVFGPDDAPLIARFDFRLFGQWKEVDRIDPYEYCVVRAISENGSAAGLTESELVEGAIIQFDLFDFGKNFEREFDAVKTFEKLQNEDNWRKVLIGPGEEAGAPADRASTYRFRWVPMSLWDALFESQSGFSTTGATVITDLEDPNLVPHCILFWRSSTHFLGGLGIIVLFVVILGQGSSGKALMRAEMPGPTKEGSMARMQSSAWLFAGIYVGLNVVLAFILLLFGMSAFDAICHAFGTMATGGFSTYNSSLGHFSEANATSGAAIEYVVTAFMILAGTNFTLLFFVMIRKPGRLFSDEEWRTYIGLILLVTMLVVIFGMAHKDIGFDNSSDAIRNGLFQVVSIITTTGYGTNDFDNWNHFGRAVLFILMFVGGCAGSTGGGMKVIRHLLFFKIIWLEIERAYRPRVVRTLKVGGKPVEDQTLRQNILVYFALILILFVFGWLFVVTFESDLTWGNDPNDKLIDSASAVAATLNNIGPGLGIVGASENYANFSGVTKLLFVLLMMLGRLEIFPILVLFSPRFWKDG